MINEKELAEIFEKQIKIPSIVDEKYLDKIKNRDNYTIGRNALVFKEVHLEENEFFNSNPKTKTFTDDKILKYFNENDYVLLDKSDPYYPVFCLNSLKTKILENKDRIKNGY